MAMTKRSKNDYETLIIGQEDEPAQAGTYGMMIGGHYGTAHGTLDAGDFGVVQLNTSGHLMVDIGAGEVVASMGTVGVLEDGTIGVVSSVTNLASGTVKIIQGGSIVVTAGTISTQNTVGTVGVLNAGSIVVTAGTIGDLDTVGTVGVLNDGSVAVTAGTVVNTPINSVASYKGTVTITTPQSAGTLASSIAGLVRYVTQVTPDLTGTGTATTCLVDSAGGTIVALAAQNESVTTCYGTIVPISTDMKWISTADGTQSASVDVVLDIHYQQ